MDIFFSIRNVKVDLLLAGFPGFGQAGLPLGSPLLWKKIFKIMFGLVFVVCSWLSLGVV